MHNVTKPDILIVGKSEILKLGYERDDMIATLRKKAQITIPSDIVNKLGLEEGDQLEVREQDGAIMLLPLTVYPSKYIEELKKEVDNIKSKIAEGEQPVFDTVDALFESLEK